MAKHIPFKRRPKLWRFIYWHWSRMVDGDVRLVRFTQPKIRSLGSIARHGRVARVDVNLNIVDLEMVPR